MELVFVHGWGFNSTIWRDVLAHLPGDRVHFIDLQFIDGFEGTPEADLPASFIGVGHSLGVLYLLKRHADALAGLVSIAGFDNFCQHVPARQTWLMQRNLQRDAFGQMQRFWQACATGRFCPPAALDRARLSAGLDWLMQWDARPERAALRGPILSLASRDDRIVPPAMTEAIWSAHDIAWLETGGHALPLHQAQWCARQIGHFVENVR